ncbi:MAG TPA: efflux RND transporter periplasmic adaptor subunit, partial [Anaerolineae bacterium]|nr:efflux RND transporter periplasmic adaptor subunit [Anaerolineae bacterium]
MKRRYPTWFRMARAPGFAILAILLLTACGSGSQSVEPTPTPFPTPIVPEKPVYTVARGTVTKTLEFTGRVTPVEQQELFFRTDGFVNAVYVERDARVTEGDVLAELDLGELENQLAQAQLDLLKAERQQADALAEAQSKLDSARTRLQQAQAKDVQAEVIVREIAVIRAREALAHAQDEYNKAVNRPWETDDSMRAYKQAVTDAERNLEIAEAEYNAALAAQKSHAFDVELLKQEVALAERQLARLTGDEDTAGDLNVEQARLDIKKIEDQIAAARLIAPFDGTVLSLNVRAGSRAEAFRAVAVVGDPGTLEITADLEAGQVSELSVDQPAIVRLRSRPEEDLAGRVRQL